MLLFLHLFNLLTGLLVFVTAERINDGYLILTGGAQMICGVAGVCLWYTRTRGT